MIRFIDEHRDQFGLEPICRVLRATDCGFIPPQAGGAPTSRGYRAAKTRPRCARAIRDDVLVEEVKRLHAQNYGVYGHRKMWHAMRRRGRMIGRDQTRSAHENGWAARRSPRAPPSHDRWIEGARSPPRPRRTRLSRAGPG